MDRKLRWKVVGIEENIDSMISLIKEMHQDTPKENARTLRKLGKWIDDLVFIRNVIRNITDRLIPFLEKKLGTIIENPGILIAAFFQPSSKNLFLELDIFFSEIENCPIPKDTLADLSELGEVGKVLALVGDAALDLAVLPYVWESEISNVGKISQKRSEYVSNNHLASVCDKWGLYDYRIHFDPSTTEKSEINHIKGTLVEAIFGIVYLFDGLEVVNRAIPLLRTG